MIFIQNLNKITEEKYSIGFTHYCPLDKECGYKINGHIATKEELEKEGTLLEVSLKEVYEHKEDIMYYNPLKKEVFWEKQERNIDNKNDTQNDKEETFAQTLAQLTIGNKQKDTIIKNLSQTVAKLTIEVNKLKGDVE